MQQGPQYCYTMQILSAEVPRTSLIPNMIVNHLQPVYLTKRGAHREQMMPGRVGHQGQYGQGLDITEHDPVNKISNKEIFYVR